MDRRTRAALSDLAARIMAESGLDWMDARTKAAKRLGIAPGVARQIDATEIQTALRTHQALYQPHAADLLHQRREAAAHAMRVLADFDPWLVGPVAEGTITEHSPIELLVWTDSEKEVEHRLLNGGIGFTVQSRPNVNFVTYRCDDSEPVVLITANIRGGAGQAPAKAGSAVRLSLRDLEALLASDLPQSAAER